MPRPKNQNKTIRVAVPAPEQIADLLTQIAATGLIGQTGPQVALHFIQEGVMKALDNPHFELKRKPAKRR